MKKNVYAGLFMVTLATLMLEILLTRIFSVTMWFHFAFVAISVALFGMTVGAIIVYLLPNYFTQERAKHRLAASSLLFSISIVFSFLTQLSIPFVEEKSIVGLYSIALTYAALSVPFVFSGICVCVALTKFPKHVSKLYAVDLAGAALGCILLIWILKITDGPTAVLVVAFLASVGAVCFAAERSLNRVMRVATVISLLLAFFSIAHTVLVHKQSPLLRIIWVKGRYEAKPLYEKWNAFSRVRIFGNQKKLEKPFGWGITSIYRSDQKVKQLHMNIDASAGTVITAFDGNLNNLEYLKYDVTNFPHYLRSNAKVLIIGTGGGRDILSALVFKQRLIFGVEINKDIIDIVNQRFGDFTGHLDKNPKVFFINDEARSYIARSKEKFDIIQVSLIDTWAATASGAFVLTENSLYTTEAWKVFIEHLTPNGILSFSRWYHEDNPGEAYRLTSLASASLMKLGVKDPRGHIVIVKCKRVATLLVRRAPFSDKELDMIENIANDVHFDIVLTPRVSVNSTFATLGSGKDLDVFTAKYPINIAAPTDDSPFFFHMLRFKNIFDRELWRKGDPRQKAISVLGCLLIIVIMFTFLCIIIPLILTAKKANLRGSLPFFIFFMAIGFGFMLVEISQMQRLIIFLGHPTYGLSVVLFALLLSSGIGSYLTQKAGDAIIKKTIIACSLLLLCTLLIFGILTPIILAMFQGSSTIVRICIAVGMLFPLGFFMGMPFPLGMKLAATRSASIVPWFWGINGAASVCASVFAIVISLCLGISATFWAGFLCYMVAFIMFVWASVRTKRALQCIP
ncbi:MAG: hypothetical protein ABH865_02840 [Candidatus Omnitrophota bacterium]